ncbi:hypothetical protein KDH_05860 [Dictyobacter sp. S3.2.2.5]|uniref:6-phosphogluconolactonase n=1 Tax=Dictyobacter halimunensis TaxID=3026934 RepID=A0ABQ6FJC5_9CHLR|nr:hypothetical protein KDH_05860 [Dictyobacter sp. S3.2.2.5]
MSLSTVYVGSYAEKDAQSIYVYRLDSETGKLTLVNSTAGILNPSFLTVNADQTRLYAVSETDNQPGSVVAYALNSQTGELTRLNEQSTNGAAPCHLALADQEQYLTVANYLGGNICLYPVLPDGQLGDLAYEVQHHGSSINTERQDAAHPHSTNIDPSGGYVYVPDLGLDKIIIYKLDSMSNQLVIQGDTMVEPGSGPRHFVFHPQQNYAYVINELSSTITAFTYNPDIQTLTTVQTVSTLPAHYTGSANTCAEIRIDPSGRFLYASNRGDDSIVVFSIDADDGKLIHVERVSTGGQGPRNFALTPDGDLLLVANQYSSNIVSYNIDKQTGKLTVTGENLQLPHPVCLKIFN